MKALVFLALITAGTETVFAADVQVQKIPDLLVENAYTLEYQFAAERVEYMNPSVSSTKITGFRDRKKCWDHAAAIAKAIREAAKETTHIGRTTFGCNESSEFRMQ